MNQSELIALRGVQGMFPVKDDGQLSDSAASYAENVDLTSGNIRPVGADSVFRGTVLPVDDGEDGTGDPMLFSVPAGRTGDIVLLTRRFDHSAALTDVSGNTRVYLAGPGVDSKLIIRSRAGESIIITNTNPTGNAIPQPPAVTVERVDPGALTTRYANAAATFVYPDGAEGPLSKFSDEIAYVPGDSLTFAPVPLPSVQPSPVGVNFYLTVPTSSNVPDIKLLVETTSPMYPTTVVIPNDIMGETVPEFEPVPVQMRTVAAAPWGGLAFTTEDEPGVVKFTDAMYLNRVFREHDVNVGARVTCLLKGANVLFALCDDGGPFVISGTALGNHIVTASHKTEILVSGPRGASAVDNTCVYAAPHGLVGVGPEAVVKPLTENVIFDWRQWQEMGPSQCALIFRSDESVVFSMPQTQKTGIIHPYGLVWRSGVRRAFAKLQSDNSIVFI